MGSLGIGAAGSGAFGYGSRIESERLELTHIRIPLPSQWARLAGCRLVWMSDLHLYPHTRLPYLERAARAAASLNPDVLLLGGDYVLETAGAVCELAPVLAAVPSRFGRFAVLGNHDIWEGRETVEAGLADHDIALLTNRSVRLEFRGGYFYLAGVDDCWSGTPDLQLALRNCPEEAPVILLSHEPDPADEYANDPRIFLQVSGHSHGGQVRFPGLGSPFLPPFGRKYPMGLYRVRSAWLYTNRGVGVTAPIRLNCRPEITLLELVDGRSFADEAA